VIKLELGEALQKAGISVDAHGEIDVDVDSTKPRKTISVYGHEVYVDEYFSDCHGKLYGVDARRWVARHTIK
jgi:hypothetical protein